MLDDVVVPVLIRSQPFPLRNIDQAHVIHDCVFTRVSLGRKWPRVYSEGCMRLRRGRKIRLHPTSL